jgi:TfoX/Sxy family transcriptional regulator of competence genes
MFGDRELYKTKDVYTQTMNWKCNVRPMQDMTVEKILPLPDCSGNNPKH